MFYFYILLQPIETYLNEHKILFKSHKILLEKIIYTSCNHFLK